MHHVGKILEFQLQHQSFYILLILESHILLSYIGNLANTAINTGVQIPFRISVFVSFGETFRREIAGFMVVLFLIF